MGHLTWRGWIVQSVQKYVKRGIDQTQLCIKMDVKIKNVYSLFRSFGIRANMTMHVEMTYQRRFIWTSCIFREMSSEGNEVM